ncbi:C6 finger domain protein, putative [Talaromyces stipitatus ATCC 10500]|uniref:C6 finger domain protein, putative n=1 Tax=Talaromyces stipitatus (strain ATCC 10500 / CBS 375.48 / QM 6759 / NRRL 1006) TaxID=441959 RepID=B8MFG5_TALSN|nr:C6 finger domain protein, putative [Talaromyces stipitatus ATCC 10500]EED16699.1 C6 finger domain protein, putative [Talaromyces stipitatus ATCC 10500]
MQPAVDVSMSNPPPAAAPSQMEPRSTPSQQLNRSCESCRSLKVRCLPDANTTNQCQRCAKANRACVFVAPQRRRPRKRTDTRVAQLEKEMAAMRTALKGRRLTVEETPDEEDTESVGGDEETDDVDFGSEVVKRSQAPNYQDIQYNSYSTGFHDTSRSPGRVSASQMSGDGSSSLHGTPALTLNSSLPDIAGDPDIVDRGIISAKTAEHLLSLFIYDLLAYFPFMVFPADTTAHHLRARKPVLFLAIMAATSIAVDVGLGNTLNHEMLSMYATRFFFKGEKSLEMVQALVLMNVYYLPPESPSQIQAYQYSHIAATMALEIGIASRKRVPRKSTPGQRQAKPKTKFDEQMAEQARAILACYHLASNVAMRTRRPNLLAYNDWIRECVRLLSCSPHDSDRRYASWFGLQVITDEALSSFGLDDTSSTAVLSETRVNGVLRLFDKKMEEWKEDIDPDFLTIPMRLECQYTTLVVYEIGIGEGYRDPGAIKRQYYTLPAPDGDDFLKRPAERLSAIRVDLTIKWMHAAQGLLDTFLECDVHTMRKMPNLTYSRTVLGLMALLKIFFSIKSGALGEVISTDSVKVEDYLEEVAQRLTEASAGSKYPIPARWLLVVGGKARDWLQRFQKHCMEREEQQRVQSKAENSNNAGNSSEATANVGPSTSTVSDAWHGGIVPLPTPVAYPGANFSHTGEHLQHRAHHHQQPQAVNPQQPHHFGGYHTPTAVQETSGMTKGPMTETANTYYPHYNQPATPWIPPSVSQGTNEYQLNSQSVWAFQQQQQQQIDLQNQHFSPEMVGHPTATGHGMFPMEMEFDWVPEHGIFQLPNF